MPPIAYTSVPRCYLRLPARSLAVGFLVQRPIHRPAVQFGWQLTPFFSKFTCTSTSTVLVGAARGISVCVATVAMRGAGIAQWLEHRTRD